ncbi:DEAH (Asp-Glu-Ala-His) box polypeptide 34 [Quaeritorhiza haematococci]|nr:DEAH (Asp-Glu-Ala-His) box polypeptide 34 [Quaeritorhiza haematococci]
MHGGFKSNQRSSRNWCKRHGVEEQRLYEIVKLKEQFEQSLSDYLGLVGDTGNLDEEEDDDEDGGDGSGTGRKRGRRQRKGKPLDFKDPEYRRRRQQKDLLERQKRLQSSQKRKVLRMDEEETADTVVEEEEEEEMDINDMSVNELEFVLRHNPHELLNKSDAGNLTVRDLNLIKLIVCAGLYPQLAIADEANHARRVHEQFFHTKTKRPDRTPYLTNVMRVPAMPACLLFGHTLDVSPDLLHVIVDGWLHLNFETTQYAERALVLGNWLRIAWDCVVEQRLKNVKSGLKELQLPTESNSLDAGEDADQSPKQASDPGDFRLIGTSMATEEIEQQNPPSETDEKGKKPAVPSKPIGAYRSNWTRCEFVPVAMTRMRHDWEDGRYNVHLGQGSFVDVTAEDVSDRLGEFLDLDANYSVERLKSLDVPKMFGYDPYAFASNMLESTAIQVTPFLRYFVETPESIPLKAIKRLALRHIDLPRKEIAVSPQQAASTPVQESTMAPSSSSTRPSASSTTSGPPKKLYETWEFVIMPVQHGDDPVNENLHTNVRRLFEAYQDQETIKSSHIPSKEFTASLSRKRVVISPPTFVAMYIIIFLRHRFKDRWLGGRLSPCVAAVDYEGKAGTRNSSTNASLSGTTTGECRHCYEEEPVQTNGSSVAHLSQKALAATLLNLKEVGLLDLTERELQLLRKRIPPSVESLDDMSPIDVFRYCTLHKVDKYVNECIVNWEEVMVWQSRGIRCVTAFVTPEEIERILTDTYPPYEEKFFSAMHYAQQVGFYHCMQLSAFDLGASRILTQLKHDVPAFSADWDHCSADMNACAAHLLGFLKARVIHAHYLRLYHPARCKGGTTGSPDQLDADGNQHHVPPRLTEEEKRRLEETDLAKIVAPWNMPSAVRESFGRLCNPNFDTEVDDIGILTSWFHDLGRKVIMEGNWWADVGTSVEKLSDLLSSLSVVPPANTKRAKRNV